MIPQSVADDLRSGADPVNTCQVVTYDLRCTSRNCIYDFFFSTRLLKV